MSRTRIGVLLAVVVVVVLLGGAATWFAALKFGPWVARPSLDGPELDAGWQTLMSRVATDPDCAGDDTFLSAALDAQDFELDAALELISSNPSGTIDPTSLPPGSVEAGELLVLWHASGGGLSELDTEDSHRLFALFHLGQIAIATGDPDQVVAALHMGQALRRCGPLVHGMVGFALSTDAFDRVPDVARSERAQPFWPVAADAVAALTADAKFSYAYLGDDDLSEPVGRGIGAWFLDLERERAMVRAFWVERLLDPPADLADLQASFAFDTPDDMPHSLVVRMLTPGIEGVIGDMIEAVERADGPDTR